MNYADFYLELLGRYCELKEKRYAVNDFSLSDFLMMELIFELKKSADKPFVVHIPNTEKPEVIE